MRLGQEALLAGGGFLRQRREASVGIRKSGGRIKEKKAPAAGWRGEAQEALTGKGEKLWREGAEGLHPTPQTHGARGRAGAGEQQGD